MGLERSVVLLHPMRDPSNGRKMAVTSSNERFQQRQGDGSYGGEMEVTAERSQQRRRDRSYCRLVMTRIRVATQIRGTNPSVLWWRVVEQGYLFIFIVQSSGRTGGSTRLLTGFTFINIGSFLSLECSFKSPIYMVSQDKTISFLSTSVGTLA